jgi:pimeloyl-ACP methyl ester carboxylesterase
VTFWTGYGYVDQLKDKFTVIAFDARGHGQSDKPHEVESYDLKLMAGDVIAIMDALGVVQSHYWGYSMGGYIGFGIAKLFPDRLSSLIVGGATPFGSSKSSAPSPLLRIFRRGVQEGVEAAVEEMREWAGSITPQYEERLRTLDYQAMVACMEYLQFRKPSLEKDMSHMQLPCLFYAGDADESAYEYGKNEVVRQIPDARFFSLPGLNHVGASAATELIIPQVFSFLTDLKE